MTNGLQAFGLDVGTRKAGGVEQQGFVGKLRRSIGDAVSDIQPRQEEGCVQYDLHISGLDPCKFVFVENWTTSATLLRHSKSAHMNAFREASAELRTDPVVLTYTRIA